MTGRIWIIQVTLALTAAVPGHELLPEKYLKPRNFNYHPYTDVGIPASLKRPTNLNNPYTILEKLRSKEQQQYPEQGVIYYPTPHTSVISKKQVETNEISKYEDPGVHQPKNYAFAYTVKNHLSGDDFSHSQAHNGKATRGEYRVKLPDGRTQIVSYTADHKGYRADVQYEDKVEHVYSQPTYQKTQNIPEVPAKLPEILPTTYHNYNNGFLAKQVLPVSDGVETVTVSALEFSGKSEHANYPVTVSNVHLEPENGGLNLLVNHHRSTALIPQFKSQYISTAAPFHEEHYVSTTASPQYLSQQYVSSTPLYPIKHSPTTPAPPIYNYQNFQASSSTVAPPSHELLVTARPVYNHVGVKAQQESLLYGLLK